MPDRARYWGQYRDQAQPARRFSPACGYPSRAAAGNSTTLDLRPALARLGLPTLIIHGDADPLVSLEAAQQMARAIPGASLTRLPGAGHVPIMTRPQAVARAIDDFFGLGPATISR